MKILTLISTIFLGLTIAYGQTEPLNKLDSNGKKDGKWIAYLDKNWKHIDDSTNAVYYRYTFYSHGTNLNPMGPCGGKGWKLESTNSNNNQTGKIKLLDGEYKWYDDKGKLRFTHILKNGEYVSYKEYFPSGQLSQEFDYTKLWEGQPHSWYIAIYDKKGNLKSQSYYRPDKNGKWPPSRG